MAEFNKEVCDFIESNEGRKTRKYIDSAGKATIGIGHLILASDPQSYQTEELSDADIDALLEKDCQHVTEYILKNCTQNLTQKQFIALVDFAFEEGLGSLQGSTLWKNIQNGLPVLEHNFTDWDKEHEHGALVEVKGIRDRREKEWALWIYDKT